MTPILSVASLGKTFKQRGYRVRAVHDVSFNVNVGETLGVVGESGCGKSTLARMLVGLDSPDAGSVQLAGSDLSSFSQNAVARGCLIQYVFQNSIGSLNPRKRVHAILDTPLRYLVKLDETERQSRSEELIDAVGLRRDVLRRFPHELSGGQAQRVGIARALAARPRVLVLDEPVSALDVSVQAQVIELLTDLRDRFDLTYIFISHDLGVVEAVSDRVAVMYSGSIVELGDAEMIFARPSHPYSARLADSAKSILIDQIARGESAQDSDSFVDSDNPSTGCAYLPRCHRAEQQCRVRPPVLHSTSAGNQVACFHPIA